MFKRAWTNSIPPACPCRSFVRLRGAWIATLRSSPRCTPCLNRRGCRRGGEFFEVTLDQVAAALGLAGGEDVTPQGDDDEIEFVVGQTVVDKDGRHGEIVKITEAMFCLRDPEAGEDFWRFVIRPASDPPPPTTSPSSSDPISSPERGVLVLTLPLTAARSRRAHLARGHIANRPLPATRPLTYLRLVPHFRSR